MVKQASVLADLESIVGRDHAGAPQDSYQVDGLAPQVAVRPGSYEEVANVLRYARSEGLAVIPWGGGTMMHAGNVPSRYDIALSLSRLDQLIEHEPADLTVTCQAGMALTQLQRHLGASGQLLPLGPFPEAEATIGGILAANASSAVRYAYGAPRDVTIGLRVVTADGHLTRAGGKVVKNVAGYDLCKLYIGSLGTLGVIVEATFKVAPVPKAQSAVSLAFPTPAAACSFGTELLRRGLSLRAMQLLGPLRDSAIPWRLDLDLAGSPLAVQRSQKEITALAAGGVASPVTPDAGQTAPATLACKLSVLPSQLPTLIARLTELDDLPAIEALPTIGVLRASWTQIDDAEATLERVRSIASTLNTSCIVERCPIELKRKIDVFGDAPPSFDLMRRVKEQFDPTSVLSPGRFLGRL